MKLTYILILTIVLACFPIESFAKEREKAKGIEILPWEEVNKILPRYSKFTVKDLETGKKFNVQRRAGSQHADVQPLTSSDTKIMKEIYSGKWSWKRRAIIVMHKDKRIAASMHGMPHGAGALKNNFPGHFCIHFYGSTTHRRNYMDLSHKLMILKAGGDLDDYLASADPYEVLSAYIAGVKQQDSKILTIMSLQNIQWNNILPRIDNVAIRSMSELPVEDLKDDLTLSVPVEIEWLIKNRGKQITRGEVHLVRFSPISPWRIDSQSLLHNSILM